MSRAQKDKTAQEVQQSMESYAAFRIEAYANYMQVLLSDGLVASDEELVGIMLAQEPPYENFEFNADELLEATTFLPLMKGCMEITCNSGVTRLSWRKVSD